MESIVYVDSFYDIKNVFDVIVVVRGGGSMEDLYFFNDEKIVDVLYLVKIFSMLVIGYESDFLLSDLVVDLRVFMFLNVMEILFFSSDEWL